MTESTFQKPKVSKDYLIVQILYLAAQDVNEMNQWLSVIRKTTISNSKMMSYVHSGEFHKNKWTCCKRALRQAGGCQLTHTHVTLSDWRDPLDPDSEAQMIFTQLMQSREELKQKFLETKEFQKDSLDHNQNFLETVKDQQFPAKPDQTSSSESERAAAVKLVDVIDELEKAHKTHDENAIKKS